MSFSFPCLNDSLGKRARLLIISAWGLSVIFSIPAVFLNEETMVKGHPQCWINLHPWQWQVYITLVFISLFFIPAVIITACYSIIVSTIWRKGRYMTEVPATATTASVPATGTSSKSVATTVFQRSSSGGKNLFSPNSSSVLWKEVKLMFTTLFFSFFFLTAHLQPLKVLLWVHRSLEPRTMRMSSKEQVLEEWFPERRSKA